MLIYDTNDQKSALSDMWQGTRALDLGTNTYDMYKDSGVEVFLPFGAKPIKSTYHK